MIGRIISRREAEDDEEEQWQEQWSNMSTQKIYVKQGEKQILPEAEEDEEEKEEEEEWQ